MRNAFAKELTLQAEQNEKIVLLSGDIGNRLFDEFKNKFPNRFYNCGVAEANMTGVAAGMAMNGLRPISYTITPFATTRCLEQIKIDICYHNLPVIIVGVGAGLSYAGLGPTHHSCEDISFLRSLPNMNVVCPGDPLEVRAALKEALKWKGPLYLRLGKKGEINIHRNCPQLKIGEPLEIINGEEIILLSVGNMLPIAVEVAKRLTAEGTSCKVVSFHTVKPLNREYLKQAFSRFSLVVSIEEHSYIGGLGSAIAEWQTSENNKQGNFLPIATKDCFFKTAGDQDYARKFFGIDSETIFRKIKTKLDACLTC